MNRFILLLCATLLLWNRLSASAQTIPTDEIIQIESMIKNIRTLDPDTPVAIDGILTTKDKYAKWFNAKDRIMFILKEPYDPLKQTTGKSAYYNQWLTTSYTTIRSIPYKDGAATYRPLATITNMIARNLDYRHAQSLYDDPKAYDTFLEQTAIINCKKEYNRNSIYTSSSELSYHISSYEYILQEQLRVYNPTVVIFGNVHSHLIKNENGSITILGEKIPSSNVYTMEDGQHKFYFNDKRVFIESYHPSARVNKDKYCTQILHAVQRWKEETGKTD